MNRKPPTPYMYMREHDCVNVNERQYLQMKSLCSFLIECHGRKLVCILAYGNDCVVNE